MAWNTVGLIIAIVLVSAFLVFNITSIFHSRRQVEEGERRSDEISRCQTSYNLTHVAFAELEEVTRQGTLYGIPVDRTRPTYKPMCDIITPAKNDMLAARRLLYNPVIPDPIMANLTMELSVRNRFHWYEDTSQNTDCYEITKGCVSHNRKMDEEFVRHIMSRPAPCYVQFGRRFVDFDNYKEAYDEASAIYINILPHPVDLFVGNTVGRRQKLNALTKLVECFRRNNDTNCSSGRDTTMSVAHFCGGTDLCWKLRAYKAGYLKDVKLGCTAPLNRAANTIAHSYAVVGTRDGFDQFVFVLEKLFPQFFAGIVELYAAYPKDKQEIQNNDLSQEERTTLEALLPQEMALYYLAKDKFKRLYECIKKS